MALLKYYPLPNLAAASGGLNYVNSDPTLSSFNQFSARVDQVINSKNTIYGTYQYYDSYDFAPSTAPGFGTGQPQRFQHTAIVDTHIFSPGLINEARAGYNRLAGLKLNQDSSLGDQVAALGLPQGGAYGLQAKLPLSELRRIHIQAPNASRSSTVIERAARSQNQSPFGSPTVPHLRSCLSIEQQIPTEPTYILFLVADWIPDLRPRA